MTTKLATKPQPQPQPATAVTQTQSMYDLCEDMRRKRSRGRSAWGKSCT